MKYKFDPILGAGRDAEVALADVVGAGTAAAQPASAFATAAQGAKADSALRDLPGVQTAFTAGTPTQQAAFQASVSGAEILTAQPVDIVLANASIGVRSGPGYLVEVYCVSGTSVTISVYDNNATGTGRVAFTQTMSAGSRASGKYPLVNGAVAIFPAGSSFEFVFSGE